MYPELSRLEGRVEIVSIFRAQSEEILKLYREHVPRYLQTLESAITDMDREKVCYQSHKLNSAMKTIGFSALAERLQYIERAKPDLDQASQLVKEVRTFIDMTLKVLDDL